MAGNQTTLILILILVCCVSSIVTASLWGTNVLCDTTNPDSQVVGMDCPSVYKSSAPGPSALTPLQTLKASGTELYTGPIDLYSSWNPAGIPVKTGTIVGSGPVTYTLAFSVKPTSVAGNWTSVFLRGNSSTNQTNRCPGVWFNPGTTQLTIIHSGATNKHDNGPVTSPLIIGSYNTIVIVIADNIMKVYINGSLDKTYTATDPFVWGSTDNGWVSMGDSTDPVVPGSWPKPTASLEVKDYYWWNKALTPSEVTTLSSTSTYMPQPLQMGTSAYTKDMYMSLKI